MRVLMVSKFLHHVGGVETYLDLVARELADRDHQVAVVGMSPPDGAEQMGLGDARVFSTPSREYVDATRFTRARSAATSIYSLAAASVIRRAFEEFVPDVVHYHGTCYQLTSSVVRAAQLRALPRVATMHEYKLACANQRLWDDRASASCNACVGRRGAPRALAPITRRCIKGSLAASAIGAIEDLVSGRVWRGDPRFLLHVPSRFMERTLLQDGWSATRLRYLDLPWPRASRRQAGGQGRDYLYMGRLAPEKDVATLLAGWARAAPSLPASTLLVAGDGSQAARLRRIVEVEEIPRVKFLGRLSSAGVRDALASVDATVHPAASFENSPLAVRESLAAGVPALVAATGGMAELVADGESGLLVEHSASGWCRALTRHAASGPRSMPALQDTISRTKMTVDQHLAGLEALYDEARQTASGVEPDAGMLRTDASRTAEPRRVPSRGGPSS